MVQDNERAAEIFSEKQNNSVGRFSTWFIGVETIKRTMGRIGNAPHQLERRILRANNVQLAPVFDLFGSAFGAGFWSGVFPPGSIGFIGGPVYGGGGPSSSTFRAQPLKSAARTSKAPIIFHIIEITLVTPR
jgi:hypothetical protein